MIWSVQLTPWALPSLLGILIALRDVNFLWPVHRERGASPLLALAGASGLWALLHLAVVASASPELKIALLRLEYVPEALAPLAWAWFGLTLTRQRKEVAVSFLGVVALGTLVTLWLALGPGADGALLRNGDPVDPGGGITGLVVGHGFWHWIHLGIRALAVLGATLLLAVHVAKVGGSGLRVATLVLAAILAIAPTILHLLLAPDRVWTDLSALGFVLASSVMGWGLLRDRLLGLGPVARAVVMEELRDPVVVLDGKGRIVDVNRAAEEILDFEPYGDVPVALGTLWAASRRSGGDERSQVELDVAQNGDLEERTFEITATFLEDRGSEGQVAMVLRDVTVRDRMERELRETHEAVQQANEELERLANTDSLTGLANRRRFMEVLSAEIERTERYGRALSLVLVDLDRFKEVNDNWGHLVGDEVLRATARVLESVCRDVDLAGRIGGEELALILPETTGEGAKAVAERLRGRIESLRHEAPGGEGFRVTGSIGIAWLDDGVRSREDLLREADRALYRAKEKGRNRVELKA